MSNAGSIAAASAELALRGIEAQTHNVGLASVTAAKAFVEEISSANAVIKKDASADDNGAVTSGKYQGYGARHIGTTLDMRQGDLVTTNDPLDLAIIGSGFGIATVGAEQKYIEDLRLKVDPNTNLLVTRSGGHVLSPGIQIQPNYESISINDKGDVKIKYPGAVDPQAAGRIDLVRFADPRMLKPEGDNLYSNTVASGEAIPGLAGEDGMGYIQQGAYEGSNTSVLASMSKILMLQNQHSAAVSLVKATNETERDEASVGR